MSGDTGRRRATILFADLAGSTAFVETAGDEAAYEVVTSCLALLDQTARRHGASLVKDRGDCVLAVFGAPQAMELGPLAAVNAAIEMRDAVRALAAGETRSLDLHIGISTGWMVSGDVEGAPFLEHALVGDTVNVGARLAALAPTGEIYVSPETYRATDDEFEYRELEPVQLKGKRDAVGCYQLLSTRSSPYRSRPGSERLRARLVGRVEELGRLQGRLRDLRTISGGVAAIVGDAGLGKSRLLAELSRTPEAQEVVWLEGRCLPTGQLHRYHPFVDMLRSWAGLDDTDAAQRARFDAILVTRLGTDTTELVLPLASLLHVPLHGRIGRTRSCGDGSRATAIGSNRVTPQRLATHPRRT